MNLFSSPFIFGKIKSMNDREMKELLKLTKENNNLLRKMRRQAIIGNIMRLVYWAIIIGGPVVIYYYYLQPYLGQLIETYSGIQSGVQNVGDQAKEFSSILDKFGIGR